MKQTLRRTNITPGSVKGTYRRFNHGGQAGPGGKGGGPGVSLHRVPHLLCWRALEVQGVRPRARRLASAAPCEGFQSGGVAAFVLCEPCEQLRVGGLEVQGVRLRARRLPSAAPCEGFQSGGIAAFVLCEPCEQLRVGGLEVQGVRLRARRLASAAPCEGFQSGGVAAFVLCEPCEQLRVGGL